MINTEGRILNMANYDAAFIIKSLGLTQVIENEVAVNVGAITDMYKNTVGGFTVYLHGGRFYELHEDQTIKLQGLLEARIIEGKNDYADNCRFQMTMQNKIGSEIQKGLASANMILDTGQRPPWRRGK